jgi:ABC-type iron transport system FetAB ATPase subunit
MADDIRFKHPFTCIVSGPSGSGKSSFTLRFVQHLYSLCMEPDYSGGIIWCYSENSAVPREKLTSLHKNVSFHEEVPQDFGNEHGKPCLIILDDLLKCIQKTCVTFSRKAVIIGISALFL